MNILITGGTGFIGKILNKKLQNEQHQTWVVTRSKSKAQSQLPETTTIIEDFSEFPQTQPLDAIINLAGEPLMGTRWNTKSKQSFIDSRVNMTEKIIQFVSQRAHKPEVLINGSAIGYYGAEQQGELDESCPAGQEFTSELCQQWENKASEIKQMGVRLCCIRIGITLGLSGGSYQEMATPFKLGFGATFGRGDQWMSWIHVDDLVNLTHYLLKNRHLSGIFNGTAPAPLTNKEFSRQLGIALKRPVWFNIPGPVLKILLGEVAHILLTGQKVIPKHALDSGFEFSYPKLSSALQQLAH